MLHSVAAAGAVVARTKGAVRRGAAPYVKVFQDAGYEHSYKGAGYLGRHFDPLQVGGNLRFPR